MATVTARRIDDRDYETLSQAAGSNGRSISEELRVLIADYARGQRAKTLIGEMKDFLARDPLKLPRGKTSTDLLREERASW